MIGPIPDTWVVDASEVRARPVAPGLWRLRLPSAYWHIDHSNAYAIEGTDGLTLVDCGSGGDPSTHEALSGALAEAGHAVEDVCQLIITHHHSDHVGAAAWVVERSGCAVALHPATGHFTEARSDPERIAELRLRRAQRGGVPEPLLDAYATVAEEQQAIDGAVTGGVPALDGTVFATGLGPAHVIETPGHAPSHIGLHLPEQRALISADLIFAGFAPYYDYGYTPDPVGEFLSSLDRVAALDIDVAMPGHGRPMDRDELTHALVTHRAGVHERLAAVRAALGDAPRTAYEVLATAFPADAGIERGAWRFVEVLGYLLHLEVLGEVSREQVGDRYDYRLTGGA
jgi:glyoxylase-like metal-dependent hydrolase (beta-lactamase superfamily II)